MKVDEVVEELRERVQAQAQTDDWLKENPPELDGPVLQNWRPFKVDVDFEGVKLLASTYEESTGEKTTHRGFRATCDATWLNENGVLTATFGPGDLEIGVHGPNEYMR
jgi:acetylornithine deacetylase